MPDAKMLAEIARLRPLDITRIDDLVGLAEDAIKENAKNIKDIFSPAGMKTYEVQNIHEDIYKAIPDDIFQSKIRHPSDKINITGKVKTLLAQKEIPDFISLLNSSVKVKKDNYPEVFSILREIRIGFDLNELNAFVITEHDPVGFRCFERFEKNPPFIAISENHLDQNSEFYLQPDELRFAIASEIAHLKFGHDRINKRELMKGATSIGLDAASYAVEFIPGGKFISESGRFAKLLSNKAVKNIVSNKVVKEIVSSKANQVMDKIKSEEEVSVFDLFENNDEEWITYPEMKLSALRAGLILTGDIKAAIRSLLLLTREFQKKLVEAEATDLVSSLYEHTEEGNVINPFYAVPIAELIRFYLSEDYIKSRNLIVKKNEIELKNYKEMEKEVKPDVETEITSEENEYIEELKFCLEDGNISDDEREHLEEVRIESGISEERGRELEKIVSQDSSYTEQELKYIKKLESFLKDGQISEDERRILERQKKKLNVSDERAQEIEELINEK